jgi:hypothetical protein
LLCFINKFKILVRRIFMNIKKGKSDKLSRRDFLKDAGLLVGGAAIGSTVLMAACAGETETETITQTVTGPGTTQTVTGPGTTMTETVTGPGTTMTETVTGPGTTSTVTQTQTRTVTATPSGDEMVTVMNPEGQVEPIELKPLAPRLDTLDGKIIYLVCVNFTATCQYLDAMETVFNEKMPNVNTRVRIKRGNYGSADEELWDEVEAEGDGYVMAVGH